MWMGEKVYSLLALLSLNELLRKRTETDVAFTLKHSRVSNPRGTIKRDQTRTSSTGPTRGREVSGQRV